MNFCEDSRILRNRVNVPPAQVQLKQNRLKRSAELNVLDGHCDNIDNNKPFHESDEPSSKRYATHQDTNNSTIIKVFYIYSTYTPHKGVFWCFYIIRHNRVGVASKSRLPYLWDEIVLRLTR